MISHSKKFIFIHIPKTGGTSIEAVLADHGIVLQGAGNFHSIYFKHIDAKQLRVMMGAEYDNYFKFSIVRNPWDWLVSMYEFCRGFSYPFLYGTRYTIYSVNESDKYWNMSFDEWLRWFVSTTRMQQIDAITGADGLLAVDKVYKFERLTDSLADICDSINVSKPEKLPKLKSSERKSFDYYYQSEDTVDFVSENFSRDITEFGYEFERSNY